LLPINLQVEGRRCVVVGGGEVAERKVGLLLECGAEVVVVSPTLTARLRRLAEQGELTYHARKFVPADLEGALLVIAATDDPAVNEQVAAEAQARGLLVNAVDQPQMGNFHFPARLRRGELLLTVSTGGCSPLLARRIREEWEQQYGPEYAALMELLGELRAEVKERIAEAAARREVWARMLDSEVLALLRAGKRDAAKELLRSCIF